MNLLYIDESGTPEIPGTSSHFVLAGLAIPVDKWKYCEDEITRIKKRYDLEDNEIHVAWLMRKYEEQVKIPDFEKLSKADRKYESHKLRTANLLKTRRSQSSYKQLKKNYTQTAAYTHLTHEERKALVNEVANAIENWTFARLFAECVDKVFWNPAIAKQSINEQAFEQIISRFQTYLKLTGGSQKSYGLLIHDNNEDVEKKHTALMNKFHKKGGTLWTKIDSIVESPFFVDSSLSNMVQLADVCSYALRRYLENQEEELFKAVFARADRKDGSTVGVRHYTKNCKCAICRSHNWL